MTKSYGKRIVKMALISKGFLLLLAVQILSVLSDNTKRKVTITPWPDCDKNECEEARLAGRNVVYAKAATTNNDILHYVFSTIGLPTVLLVRTTGEDNSLFFNWTMLNESSIFGAINFGEKKVNINYTFAVAFTRLIEYDDKDDSADLEANQKKDTTRWLIRDFNEFPWQNVSVNEKTNSFVFNISKEVMDETSETNNGTISFTFSVKGDNGRASELPCLLYGANETMFDFIMANFTPSFNNSRFALEAVVVSKSDMHTKEMDVEQTESIDDEYTPGVFQIIDWLTNPQRKDISGFFQWKPVSYISKSRGRNTASKVNYYKLKNLNDLNATLESSLINNTVVAAFISESLWHEEEYKMKFANISFGIPKDGFYVKNNYSVWTAAIGYGTPPEDTISATVIITISAGLGIPVIIIIVGGIYSIIRKMRTKSTAYQPISADSRNQYQKE
ncbi:glycosylated lysosomal membrane protein B-like [Physella acuta]|uniref:glycosylated lysosomal membrane protein B-like n=1 Tax=Physella acuta TaxID=109671 RepID=UPI0027DC4783|nr:glycosylated lysosomal membrane protein B-like [Physella acuta]